MGLLNKKITYTKELAEQAVKNELFFNLNNFNKLDTVNGLRTLAFNLRNLMLMRKGTMPDTPRMGIDILSYKHDRLDNTTINKLRTIIMDQITTYIGNYIIADLLIVNRPDKISGLKFIFFLFILTEDAKSKYSAEYLALKFKNNTGNLIFDSLEYR